MHIDFDIKNLIIELKKLKPKKLLIQVPEGLKIYLDEIITKIENENIETYISAEPVWGACDIGDTIAKEINADTILHLGHSKFTNSELNVLYWPTYYKFNIREINKCVKDIDKFFNNKTIVIVGTVQYSKLIHHIENKLIKTNIIRSQLTNLNNTKSQILGCNISSISNLIKNVDSILFIGDGNFHPEAISFDNTKPIYTYFPGKNIEMIKTDPKFKIKRILMLENAKIAKKFCIMVSYKKGQNRIDIAKNIKSYLTKNGKKSDIIIFDQINYNKIIGMGYDCLINTACPRIAYDDYKNYPVPLISVTEALKLFEKDHNIIIDRM